jgi:hypothetical protein
MNSFFSLRGLSRVAILAVVLLAVPVAFAAPAVADGQVQGVVTLTGGAPIPLAADESIAVKACDAGSTSADCPAVASTAATTAGDWNLSLPGDAHYNLWVVNLGNTQPLGGPFDVFVPEGGTATAPSMGVDVAIAQATVQTNQGTLFPPGTAGVGACLSEEPLGPDCPSLRTQFDVDGNGTVALALPPGTWNLYAFSPAGDPSPGTTTWTRTLRTGDLDPPLEFDVPVNPTPSLSVDPDSFLAEGPQGQAVVVYGSGFAPNEPVSVSQCATVPPIAGYAPCDVSGAVNPGADENGSFAVPLTVHSPMTSNVTTPETQFDCIDVGCVVVASQNGASAEHSVSFFRTPGTLSGTVRDTNGEPVPGALVGACVSGSPGPSCLNGFAATNASGAYTLQIAEGTYNVAALYGPFGFTTRSSDAIVTIVSGQTTQDQDFTLPLGKVSGSLLDGNGQPFPAGAAFFGACPAPGAALFCPGAQSASVDAAGNYTLRLGAGTYNVAGVTSPGGFSLGGIAPITIAAGETFHCDVQMPGAPVCGGDDDGVNNAVENGAPNGGDGNNDGTQDSQQNNVTSLPNALDGQYVTIAAPNGTSVANVQAVPVPSAPTPPAGATFPVGLVNFEVHGVSPGGTAAVTLHLPAGSSPNGYFKLHDGAWLDFSVNASIASAQVTLTLTDGAVGDDDRAANGTIVDPGGPAVLPSGFDFDGFFAPVDNLPTLNTVKAGLALPVKFTLGSDQGLDIFAAHYPKSEQFACSSSDLLDGVEQTVTAGGSSLSYESATDTYTYVWKTSKNWAPGTCRQLVIKLTDGSVHRANFKLK